MPETTSPTWTKHTFMCQGCGVLCYISQEAIDSQREAMHDSPEVPDEEVAEGIEYCLKCVSGEHHEGERVTVIPSGHRRTITSAESQQYIDGDNAWLKGAVWELRGLTPDDARNLDAAADFLLDAPDDWGETKGTVDKIRALLKAVKDAGVWPQPPFRVKVRDVDQTTMMPTIEGRECDLSECFPGDHEEQQRVRAEIERDGWCMVGGGAAQMFMISRIADAPEVREREKAHAMLDKLLSLPTAD